MSRALPLTIPPRIERAVAVGAVQGLARSLIGRLSLGRRRVVSSELAYLPYWCHDFVLATDDQEPLLAALLEAQAGRGWGGEKILKSWGT